jgi:IS5 family transposase
MIEVCRRQLNFAEGLIAEEVGELWEDWMRQVDEVLSDQELLGTVYEALARRWPKSRTHGRKGTPAEVVLRLLLLKHIRNWSYAILEREVRANLVYRQFTRVGAEKVPDAKGRRRACAGAGCGWIPRWWRSTFTTRPTAACSATRSECSRAR